MSNAINLLKTLRSRHSHDKVSSKYQIVDTLDVVDSLASIVDVDSMNSRNF